MDVFSTYWRFNELFQKNCITVNDVYCLNFLPTLIFFSRILLVFFFIFLLCLLFLVFSSSSRLLCESFSRLKLIFLVFFFFFLHLHCCCYYHLLRHLFYSLFLRIVLFSSFFSFGFSLWLRLPLFFFLLLSKGELFRDLSRVFYFFF